MIKVLFYELRDPNIEEYPKNVRYIGLTTRSLELRLQEHIKEKSSKLNTHKVFWIRKLIFENKLPTIHLIFEIYDELDGIDFRINNLICAPTIENFLITHYKLLGCNLVNTSEGGYGNLGIKHSEKTKKLLSNINKGELHPQYKKDLDRNLIIKEYLEGNSSIQISNKFKIGITTVMSILKQDNIIIRKPKDYSKKVAQYNLEGKLIKIWGSVREVEQTMNLTGVSRACRKKMLLKDFQWREFYKDFTEDIGHAVKILSNKHVKYLKDYFTGEVLLLESKKVLQIDKKSKKILNIYESIPDAVKFSGCSRSAISNGCNRYLKEKDKKGSFKRLNYIWRYEKDNEFEKLV